MVYMKLKKEIIVFWVIIILLIGGICIYILYTIKNVHEQILNFQKDRLPEVFISFDNSYCMRVVVDENIHDSVHYVNVIIYDNATEEEVFSIRDEYRAFDFHWVSWENANNNFWIKSGDLGIFCYEYEGSNVWEKYSLLKENDEYFLVRGYGEMKEKKNVKMEDLKRRISERCSID